jgi:hypothetical protein
MAKATERAVRRASMALAAAYECRDAVRTALLASTSEAETTRLKEALRLAEDAVAYAADTAIATQAAVT